MKQPKKKGSFVPKNVPGVEWGWVGWVMQGWGGSCRDGVGWVMQGWGGSCRGGVGCAGVDGSCRVEWVM